MYRLSWTIRLISKLQWELHTFETPRLLTNLLFPNQKKTPSISIEEFHLMLKNQWCWYGTVHAKDQVIRITYHLTKSHGIPASFQLRCPHTWIHILFFKHILICPLLSTTPHYFRWLHSFFESYRTHADVDTGSFVENAFFWQVEPHGRFGSGSSPITRKPLFLAPCE